ncbi:SDR family oxidoreductase [Curtobacterium flaccumfaciens pv. flaccumfaciens]|uniref:SDR family oxidoreductase n=1 Tax=Curtobacterium flaccumfaciens TaxID=2035 RepID=UPI001BCFDBFD|nr:SDR family oxidoreductase [Curtobacterium flaccumfaciens]QVG65578.1 SDR family oxidoreductase [Curtobacterium flaccumfaciens pv. flaccumfaciens]
MSRQENAGQSVLVIGGSSGIGLAIASKAAADGDRVELIARNADRLASAAAAVGAADTATFDVYNDDDLTAFVDNLAAPFDHVFVGSGNPFYATLPEIDAAEAAAALGRGVWLMIRLAQLSPKLLRPGGSLTFMSGTSARRPGAGMSLPAASIAANAALTANLALEAAPVRINSIAAGFVDTPLSARLLGDDLDARRDELRRTLPVHRVVQAEDVAMLARHLMTNSVLTGTVFDIDGGQQLLS